MKIYPQANNSITLFLENGNVLNLHEGASGHLCISANMLPLEIYEAGTANTLWQSIGKCYTIKIEVKDLRKSLTKE